MSRRTIPVDICFVLDATQGNQSMFRAMIDQISDLDFDLKVQNRSANIKFGAVIMGDPAIWKPFPISFTENIENIIIKLLNVQCGGGNDESEDWAGSIQCALNLNWRQDSKKIIVMISDANAHGKKFCGYDNHNDQEDILTKLVQTIAQNKYCFIGINIIKSGSQGCKKTLNEMKTIYEEAGGQSFISEEFIPNYDEELLGTDNWPQEVLENFMQAVIRAIYQVGRLDESEN